ncbi:LrgB family protein [Metabacillus rhizolycopersici]|uniref:LrgB family protein n=1 Tax=Metabacillus rhizolycopersici TaxID=2875709 RepID=A0ABS7UUM5_9BACI|nr:LrgB family protein [Metabacillus rhizolycopersici]MBZ5752018.1 LrgB family protein [Metabacillus rhizolycopersici]
MNVIFLIVIIGMTIVSYFLMKWIYGRFPHPILVPVFTTTIVLVCLLLVTNTSYTTYMSGAKWINELLGPAIVAFAIPLYDYRETLKKNALTIFVSVLVGSIVGIISGIILGISTHVNKEFIFSLAPKSVTTPIAMEISEMVGGTPALAAVYVVIAGISGAMFGPFLMRVFKIKHSISKGIGFGTAAHAIGTSRALENSEAEGAFSSIAMTVSAIITSFLCPIILSFFF